MRFLIWLTVCVFIGWMMNEPRSVILSMAALFSAGYLAGGMSVVSAVVKKDRKP